MEFRPATLLEQGVRYWSGNREPNPLAILHGTVYADTDEWEDLPNLDQNNYALKTLKQQPSDISPAKCNAVPRCMQHDIEKMPLVGQECYTVLSSLAEDGAIYSVPAKLKALCQEKARVHRCLAKKTYCWITQYKSRTYVLYLQGTSVMFILLSYDTKDFNEYMAGAAKASLEDRLQTESFNNRCKYQKLPFGIYVPNMLSSDYEIGCWCEAKGYNHSDVVLEFEHGEEKAFLVNTNRNSLPTFVLQTTVDNVLWPEKSFSTPEEARAQIRTEAKEYKCRGLAGGLIVNAFGCEDTTADGKTIRWKIVLRQQNDR